MNQSDMGIKVISAWEYQCKEEKIDVDIKAPQVYGTDHQKMTLTRINRDIVDVVNENIHNFNTILQEYKDAALGLNISYEVVTDTEDWFTLKLTILNIAASSDTKYKFYNVNLENNQWVHLKDLFIEGYDYIKVISDNIKMQMKEQMKKDENIIYFIKDEDNLDGFDQISPDQNFYFNEDDNLVIVFNQGEVAPSSMGTPEFVIPDELFYEKQ